jgi:uncharacterized protein (TIRG00374 family)
MQKKRLLISAVVVALLGLLIYTQFREWRNFDWPTFWAQTHQIRGKHIIHGILLIYLHYGLRALRWKIFLKPLKKTSWLGLVPPTVIGFTGLALLGRPGEFIRPYLIARREGLSLSSQIAVWTVERIFDLGAFAVLLVGAVVASNTLQEISHPFDFYLFHIAGRHFVHIHYILTAALAAEMIAALAIGLAVVAVLVAKYGNQMANWAETQFRGSRELLGKRIATKIREFGLGLNTIDSPLALGQLSAVSVTMWFLIAVAYREVTHAYVGVPALHALTTSKVLLLMASSMLGSMVQLPAVGGGSQVATISALSAIFHVPKESAVSCGMLLWLVTFMSVAPLGLALAHRAHLSLRQLSKESAEAESTTTPATM